MGSRAQKRVPTLQERLRLGRGSQPGKCCLLVALHLPFSLGDEYIWQPEPLHAPFEWDPSPSAELNDVEVVMRIYFECLALVSSYS